MPKVAIGARLKEFNLDAAKIKLVDLEVAANKIVILDSKNRALGKNVAYIEPKSIVDLKRWIGIPDSAFAQAAVAAPLPHIVLHPSVRPGANIRADIVIPPMDSFHPDQIATLRLLSKNFIFGNSASVSKAQLPALNQWLIAQKIKIPIFVFNDIHVASGAVLNIKNKILFANHITIDKGGLIKAGNQCAIHAAGVKGL